jgi:hypothetical protein
MKERDGDATSSPSPSHGVCCPELDVGVILENLKPWELKITDGPRTSRTLKLGGSGLLLPSSQRAQPTRQRRCSAACG